MWAAEECEDVELCGSREPWGATEDHSSAIGPYRRARELVGCGVGTKGGPSSESYAHQGAGRDVRRAGARGILWGEGWETLDGQTCASVSTTAVPVSLRSSAVDESGTLWGRGIVRSGIGVARRQVPEAFHASGSGRTDSAIWGAFLGEKWDAAAD